MINMTSKTNEPITCSGCSCSLHIDKIQNMLDICFNLDISSLISKKIGGFNNYRITHFTGDWPPHSLCPECEDYFECLVVRLDTNTFTCPHDGCRRMIITG